MTYHPDDRTPARRQWQSHALLGSWPLPIAALCAALGDSTVWLWFFGLFVLLQFAAAATYLARSRPPLRT